MPLVRMIVSVRTTLGTPERDAIVNTLYFNVSGSVEDPNYQTLVNDLFNVWQARPWGAGRYIDIRAYNMDDAKPRPIKAQKQATATGTGGAKGVPQVALCLSYFASRNLPRSRGRIYLGPWATSAERPDSSTMNSALALAQPLADLGGINVDWSVYSPTTNDHERISHVWVDNAWDIIRSRRLEGTSRVELNIDG